MCQSTSTVAYPLCVASLGLHVNRDGDVPVGTQLAWQIQALITGGRLQPGEQLPSVRRLAEVAGVNVNTVRSVYERLEGEGFVHTQHGRGTFVADNVPQLNPDAAAARVYAGSGDVSRKDLREQIAGLEAQLSAHVTGPGSRRSETSPRVLTTDELAEVRDELIERLEQLDAMREDLVGLLASLRAAMGEPEPAAREPERGARKAAARRPRPATG
jgi:DNA-binding transcriptional regulator YhcF (GntR family)